jgi:hypothetical protein
MVHFTISGNKTDNKVYLTVNDGTTNVISNSVISNSFVNVTSLYFNLGNAHAEIGFDDMLLQGYSDLEIVSAPSIEITEVNGIDREVTITSGTSSTNNSVTTYYTTDGNDPTSSSTAYTTPITISSDCTIKAITISSANGASGITSLAVTTGNLTLNTPTWSKTGYSDGVSTVTLSSNQSSVLLSPNADIYYKINDGEATKYTAPISVNDGETLKYYATATGYTNSAEGSVTAVAPNTNPIIWTDSYSSASDEGISAITSAEATRVSGTDYYPIQANNTQIGFYQISYYLLSGSNSISNWLYRSGGIYGGAGKTYALANLKAGDYVILNGKYGNDAFSVSSPSNMTLDEWNSVNGSKYCYTVTNDGPVTFNIARYGYLTSITVQSSSHVSATIGANGYTTFASPYCLDLAHLPEGLKAYTATLSGITLSFTECTKAVAAGTGLLLQGTANTAYEIPVVASGTAITDNALTGVTTPTDKQSDANGKYYFVMKKTSEGLTFAPLSTTSLVTIPAGKAYIEVLASAFESPARALVLTFDDVTSVKELKNSRIEELKVYYNLQGQRVASPKKGLYIVNGRKVQVK